MLPTLRPNSTLVAALVDYAARTDNLAALGAARIVARGVHHYAVETHVHPDVAAFDAARFIAANSRSEADLLRWVV